MMPAVGSVKTVAAVPSPQLTVTANGAVALVCEKLPRTNNVLRPAVVLCKFGGVTEIKAVVVSPTMPVIAKRNGLLLASLVAKLTSPANVPMLEVPKPTVKVVEVPAATLTVGVPSRLNPAG